MTAPTIDVKPLFVRWIKLSVTDAQAETHEFQCAVTQAGLTSTGGEPVSLNTLCPEGSFSESTERVWNLTVTGVQDVESEESFQLFLLEHDGEEATFEFYPKTTKDGTPVGVGFTGLVTIVPPDNIGNAPSGTFATFTATLPLKGKYTMVGSTIVATGATAGTPGTFTPAGAAAPANLAALQGASPAVVASPLTAWTTGQNVVLGDASKAHWSSTAWVTGIA